MTWSARVSLFSALSVMVKLVPPEMAPATTVPEPFAAVSLVGSKHSLFQLEQAVI